MTRREFLRTGGATAALLGASPSWCAPEKPSPPEDHELLSGARAAIDRNRRSDGLIRFRKPEGNPVEGLKVEIEQLAHEFGFGCNLFCFGRCSGPDQEQGYRQRFAELFNYCTIGFYWAAYELQPGKPAYGYTEQVLDWARSHHLRCKGHPLVWDHPAGSPQWLPDDPAEIARLVTGRVKELVSRYREQVEVWDVVNEATHLPDQVNKTKMAAWGASIGSQAYAAEPLRVARSANRQATLLLNDYRVDPAYFHLLTSLRDGGRPLFDAIGLQTHMHDGVWPLHKLLSICQQFSRLGLPLHFTETTILSGRRSDTGSWGTSDPQSESEQAEAAGRFYTMLFAQPSVTAITWWDLSDYHAWQNAPAGLLREDMSPKPSYAHLQNLIKKEWWTRTTGATDKEGTVRWRGFRGNYRITAETASGVKASKEFSLQHREPNEFVFNLD